MPSVGSSSQKTKSLRNALFKMQPYRMLFNKLTTVLEEDDFLNNTSHHHIRHRGRSIGLAPEHQYVHEIHDTDYGDSEVGNDDDNNNYQDNNIDAYSYEDYANETESFNEEFYADNKCYERHFNVKQTNENLGEQQQDNKKQQYDSIYSNVPLLLTNISKKQDDEETINNGRNLQRNNSTSNYVAAKVAHDTPRLIENSLYSFTPPSHQQQQHQQFTYSTTSSTSSSSSSSSTSSSSAPKKTQSIVVNSNSNKSTNNASDSSKTNAKYFKPTSYYTSYANDKNEIDYSTYLYSDSTTEMYKKKYGDPAESKKTVTATSKKAYQENAASNVITGLKKSDITKIDSIIDKVFANNNLYGKKLIVKEETLNSIRDRSNNNYNGTRTVIHMPSASTSHTNQNHYQSIQVNDQGRKQMMQANNNNSKYLTYNLSNNESKANLNEVYSLDQTYTSTITESNVNESIRKGYVPNSSSSSLRAQAHNDDSRSMSRKQMSYTGNKNDYSSYNFNPNDSRTNLSEIYSLATIYNTLEQGSTKESDLNYHDQGRESRRDALKTRTKYENAPTVTLHNTKVENKPAGRSISNVPVSQTKSDKKYSKDSSSSNIRNVMRSLSRDFVSKTTNTTNNVIQNTPQVTVKLSNTTRDNSLSGVKRDTSSTSRATTNTATILESNNIQSNLDNQLPAKKNLTDQILTKEEKLALRESRSRQNQHLNSNVRSVSTASFIEKSSVSALTSSLKSNININDVRSHSVARLMQDSKKQEEEQQQKQQRESRSRSNQPANVSTSSVRSLSTASISDKKMDEKENLTLPNTIVHSSFQPSNNKSMVRSSSISGKTNDVGLAMPTTTMVPGNNQYNVKKVNSRPAPTHNILIPSPSMTNISLKKLQQQPANADNSKQQITTESIESTKVRVISKDTLPPKPSISRSSSSNSVPLQTYLKTTESSLHQLEALQESYYEKYHPNGVLNENNPLIPSSSYVQYNNSLANGVSNKESSASNNTQKILNDSVHLKKLIKNYLKAELKNLPYINILNKKQTSEQVDSNQNSFKINQNPSPQSTIETTMTPNKNLKSTNPNESKNITEYAGPFYDKNTNQIFFKDKLNNIVNNNLSVAIPNIVNNVNRILAPTLPSENSNSSPPPPLLSSLTGNKNSSNIYSNSNENASYFRTDNAGSKRFNLEDYLFKPTQPLDKDTPKKETSTSFDNSVSDLKAIKLNSNSSNNLRTKATKQTKNAKSETQNNKNGEGYTKSLSKTNVTLPSQSENSPLTFIPIRANDFSLKLFMHKPLISSDTNEDTNKQKSKEASPNSFLSEKSYTAASSSSPNSLNMKTQPKEAFEEMAPSSAIASSPILLSTLKTHLSKKISQTKTLTSTLSPSPVSIPSPSLFSPDSDLKSSLPPFSPRNLPMISTINKSVTPNKLNDNSNLFEQINLDDSFNMHENVESLILSPNNQSLNEEIFEQNFNQKKKQENNLLSPSSEAKLDEIVIDIKACPETISENLIGSVLSSPVEEEINNNKEQEIQSIDAKVLESKSENENVQNKLTEPENSLFSRNDEEDPDEFFQEKQINLFSFEETIEQDFTFPENDTLDSIPEEYQRNSEFVNPNIQFITKGRDLPIIFENDDEEIEEKMLKELHEKMKKEKEMFASQEIETSCSENNDSDEEIYEEIQYLY